MKNKVLNIIILGPQGSGKGTQAKVLAKKFNLEHIVTGEIFRKFARKRTALCRKIDYLMNKKGRLIPTPLVIKILKIRLRKINKNKGIIFDGYPRNLMQAKALEAMLRKSNRKIDIVFYLPISQKTTTRRLGLRRSCQECGQPYILGVDLKKNQKTCPKCGGKIIIREDDKPKAILERLKIFNRQTKPLIKFYKKKRVLIEVDGEPPIPVVARKILKYLK